MVAGISMWVILSAIFGLMVFILLISAAARYKRCPSNKILVKYGKVGKDKSAECIHGGATFVWPLLQSYEYLDLIPMTIEVSLKSALSKQNIRINVPSRFTIGVSTEPHVMQSAAERLLGLSLKEIETRAEDIILGQLRATIATMKIEEINSDREGFEKKVQDNVESELNKIGLKLINVNITDITDESGYIEALGKQAAAEAINNAKVQVAEQDKAGASGEAEARKDQTINVTGADREGAVVRAQNEAKISEADKERDVKRAQYTAETQAEEARRDQAKPKADAVARQAVVVEEVKVEERRQQALVAVKEREIEVAEKSQQATVVVPALKLADAAEAKADGDRRAAVKTAEGQKQSQILAAEAEKQKRELEGQGEAAQIKAVGLAEAARVQAIGEAEGAAIKAKLLAEAEGVLKKAEAYAKLDKAGALQMVLEKLPEIIGALAPVMAAIAKPMEAIDKVVVIEQGNGGGGSGQTGVSRFTGNVPGILFSFLQKAGEMGIDVGPMLKKVGIDVEDLFKAEAHKPTAEEHVDQPAVEAAPPAAEATKGTPPAIPADAKQGDKHPPKDGK